MFLFPGLFLYDSSLTVAADHIAAFWAIPSLLALLRAIKTPDTRRGIWLSVPLAGALLTKYQAMSIVLFPLLAQAIHATWTVLQGLRRRAPGAWRPAIGPASTWGALVFLTTPHWLKNWIWYGDPIYPFLHRHLSVRPWTVDSANLFEEIFKGQQLWRPTGTVPAEIRDTLETLVTFAFRPHDWGFHGKVPVFGSLFTLFLAPLLFLRGSRRIWMVAGAAEVGIFSWYWSSHQDRYLQALVPWMASVVAAVAYVIWQRGIASRVALGAVITLQVVWGGDVYFIPAHVTAGNIPPAKATIDLLSTGYRKAFAARQKVFGNYTEISRKAPKDAKILVHDCHAHLGVDRMTVSDIGPWQGGISWGRMPSPSAFYDRMHEYGVTHFMWRPGSTAIDSLAGDIVFFTFIARYTQTRHVGDWNLSSMPAKPPPSAPWGDTLAAVFGCVEPYQHGLYTLSSLVVPTVGPRTVPPPLRPAPKDADPRPFLDAADYLLWDAKCRPGITPGNAFQKMAVRSGADIWIRTRPLPKTN
jgi:hypothetical protein